MPAQVALWKAPFPEGLFTLTTSPVHCQGEGSVLPAMITRTVPERLTAPSLGVTKVRETWDTAPAPVPAPPGLSE